MNTLTTISTVEPAIYVSVEFSEDYDAYEGKGSWKWVAKRSWTCGGATRTEIFEVPQHAEGAEREDVGRMIQGLTGAAAGSNAKYAVSCAGDTASYIAVRVE
ncbi:hypothetical protein PS417_10750 [Pseudomonas simiae]|jgi:hypothetical protein|uniref:Uncharacterized protein n=1 Tax=Pseudomonas simiae TaxID=321846 RepID=A0A1N7UGD4_9PSED|nr:hypothetical protein PS417_10750 [Pseudomonas simiae]